MDIDMPRAFDTIKRKKALDVLNMAGCNDDDHQLVRVLLANTHLTIKSQRHTVSMVRNFPWIPSSGLIVLCTLHLLPSCCIMCSTESTSWLNLPSTGFGSVREVARNH